MASQSQTTIVYSSSVTAPKITTAILDSGVVIIYFNLGSTTAMNIVQLDFTDNDLYNIYAKLTPGKFYLYSVDEDLSTIFYSGQTYYWYRYIVIPGGAHLRSAINWKDYKQAKAYLGLKD